MVDWMDRGVLDLVAFVMAIHILHRHKRGVPIPPEIPYELWASFGPPGLQLMAKC